MSPAQRRPPASGRRRNLRVVRPDQAEQEERFLAALDEMPASYIACRARQHSWDTLDPMRLIDTAREEAYGPRQGHRSYVVEKLRCDRCGMVRVDFYLLLERRNHTVLRKIGMDYDPPPGYATKGTGNARGLREFLLGAEYENTVFAAAKPTKPKPRERGKR